MEHFIRGPWVEGLTNLSGRAAELTVSSCGGPDAGRGVIGAGQMMYGNRILHLTQRTLEARRRFQTTLPDSGATSAPSIQIFGVVVRCSYGISTRSKNSAVAS
jgi:hypothetical protein